MEASLKEMEMEITRYKNRKLYSKELGTYVTLADIRELIQTQKKSVRITDFDGTDITAKTLTQVLAVTKNVPVSTLQTLIEQSR
jgi:polyhydroxyalkanoate synthesis regulator protein